MRCCSPQSVEQHPQSPCLDLAAFQSAEASAPRFRVRLAFQLSLILVKWDHTIPVGHHFSVGRAVAADHRPSGICGIKRAFLCKLRHSSGVSGGGQRITFRKSVTRVGPNRAGRPMSIRPIGRERQKRDAEWRPVCCLTLPEWPAPQVRHGGDVLSPGA